MSINLLLNNICSIRKKYEEINKRTGQNFNIFSILGIEHDEVKICRVLTELLNPKGCHYQKDKYLKLFVKNVLNMSIDESKYDNVQVFNEYTIDNNRRIDIVIKFEDFMIPIEVKIYAGDQGNQCFNYYSYASKHSKKEIQVVYLTLDGNIPSKSSADKLTPITKNSEIIGYKEIKIISFKENIIEWLEECISDIDTLKISPIREVLIQFMNVIRDLTNLLEKNEKMEIINEIMSSKDNMKAACGISKSIIDAKQKMMEKIFIDIENKMEERCNKYPIKKVTDVKYYDYNDKIKEYYDKKSSSYPGINYLCTNVKLKNDLELWFRIELGDILFCGFCVFNREINKEFYGITDEIYDELKSYIPITRNKNWWVLSCNIPEDNNSPNFKTQNDNLFNLFDKEYYDKFIDQCMKKIDTLLDYL